MPLLEWLMADAPTVKVPRVKEKRVRERKKRRSERSVAKQRAVNPRRR